MLTNFYSNIEANFPIEPTRLVNKDASIAQLERLENWIARAKTALPHATQKALMADLRVFHDFCLSKNIPTLPATEVTVSEFVESQSNKSPATIRRYLSSIRRWHKVIDAKDPTDNETVNLSYRSITIVKTERQKQADALNWTLLTKLTQLHDEFSKGTVSWFRDRAMLWMSYDLMTRRSELVKLDASDLTIKYDDTGTAYIATSKTDQKGKGHFGYLSKTTVKYLQAWLDARPKIITPLFTSIQKGGKVVAKRLSARSVNSIFKKRAKVILKEDELRITGHSARIGAAQDLTSENFSMAAIKQAGRWKSDQMPSRYTEKLAASKSAMAKLAVKQGRS